MGIFPGGWSLSHIESGASVALAGVYDTSLTGFRGAHSAAGDVLFGARSRATATTTPSVLDPIPAGGGSVLVLLRDDR